MWGEREASGDQLAVRPRALLVPGSVAATNDLPAAIEAAGYGVVLRTDVVFETGLAPQVIILNVFALGVPEEWPEALTRLVGRKIHSGWAEIPMLIVDPPASEWDMIGGWLTGVDAYLIWPAASATLARMLKRITAGDDVVIE